jgi:uncharacterized protein YbjT (DUF2867 family)
MKSRTALVFGSTGLVGKLLLEELIRNQIYSGIKIFVRQKTDISDPKVEEFVTDLSTPDLLTEKIIGEDLFICLGTTIKKAGSITRMETIDRDLTLKVASSAAANGVKRVAVISSVGANPLSSNYYLRMKGEMERGILDLNFEQIAIVRPSILLGERKERRTGERIGKVVMKIVKPLLWGKLRKYRGINGNDVARAMIFLMQKGYSKGIYESDELQMLADQYKNKFPVYKT